MKDDIGTEIRVCTDLKRGYTNERKRISDRKGKTEIRGGDICDR